MVGEASEMPWETGEMVMREEITSCLGEGEGFMEDLTLVRF